MANKHRILLVEDRPSDVRLTVRAIVKAGYDVDVEIAQNGQEALDKLSNIEESSDRRLPDLVLLDWMMPLVNGEEVLEAMHGDERLRQIPVVVLTTSSIEADVRAAYRNGCNAYLVKPVNPLDFQKTIDALGLFWLQHAILPKIK